jgi:hypothetical protein
MRIGGFEDQLEDFVMFLTCAQTSRLASSEARLISENEKLFDFFICL